MPLNGIALTSVAAGALFTWSGVRGWGVLGTMSDVIAGRKPRGSNSYPLTAPESAGSNGATGSAVSDDALKYKGHAYSYGGAPGTSGNAPWDCSSFVNWVVGHDLGDSIPGMGPGKYNGTSHGPPTGMWGIWPGLKRISRSQVRAGDIIVWTGHMGIAISNSQMISAQSPANGTRTGPIDGGGNGPLLKYGRL